jgi:hypothetical protein
MNWRHGSSGRLHALQEQSKRKEKKILPLVITSIKLEDIMLSEICQTQKGTCSRLYVECKIVES